MAHITWFYGRTGPGQVADIVSHAAPVQASLASHAKAIGARAEHTLNTAPKTRTGDSQVNVFKADLDWYVEVRDKGMAAGAIEKRFQVLRQSL